MDEISQVNRQRWNALARANVEYSLPFLNLTPEQARQFIGRRGGILKEVKDQRVLCLASGGGQDSAAFGLLGAQVSVFDLSDVQLERDRQAAARHGYPITTQQGDMRDLSIFPAEAFDVVWQTYSINFVPSVEAVFAEVRRVLKRAGIYYLSFANPFVQSVDNEHWDGQAYPLANLYLDGEDLSTRYPHWDVTQPDGSLLKMDSPHEYRHSLSRVLNSLAADGFVLLGLWEWMKDDPAPLPGSWAHFTQVAPPYLDTFWRLEKPV